MNPPELHTSNEKSYQCSASGSTHTESGKLYRKVKHRARPNSCPQARPKVSSRQRPKRASTKRRSLRWQRRRAPHTEHGLVTTPHLASSHRVGSSAGGTMMMMFTPERHLPTSGQHGPAPSGTPPPAQPPTPPQTRETQSHSAPTPLKRPMLTPEGGPRPRVTARNALQLQCVEQGRFGSHL